MRRNTKWFLAGVAATYALGVVVLWDMWREIER